MYHCVTKSQCQIVETEWRIYGSLNWVTFGSDNGLSPTRRQAIIWTNARILLTGSLGTKFTEILIEIHTFSFKKMYLKMSSGKWRPTWPPFSRRHFQSFVSALTRVWGYIRARKSYLIRHAGNSFSPTHRFSVLSWFTWVISSGAIVLVSKWSNISVFVMFSRLSLLNRPALLMSILSPLSPTWLRTFSTKLGYSASFRTSTRWNVHIECFTVTEGVDCLTSYFITSNTPIIMKPSEDHSYSRSNMWRELFGTLEHLPNLTIWTAELALAKSFRSWKKRRKKHFMTIPKQV